MNAELEDRINDTHIDNPQRAGLARLHLDEIKRGIAGLASLGHRVRLEFEAEPAAVQFPTMVYHPDLPERLVYSSTELDAALADGWFDHPRLDRPKEENLTTDELELAAKPAGPEPVNIYTHPMVRDNLSLESVGNPTHDRMTDQRAASEAEVFKPNPELAEAKPHEPMPESVNFTDPNEPNEPNDG